MIGLEENITEIDGTTVDQEKFDGLSVPEHLFRKVIPVYAGSRYFIIILYHRTSTVKCSAVTSHEIPDCIAVFDNHPSVVGLNYPGGRW